MSKFIFNLEGVLRQRKHVEREKQRELAVRLKSLTHAEVELRRLRDALHRSNDDVRQNRLTGPLDLRYLAAHRRFLIAMQRQAVAIAQRIVAAQQQVDEARRNLAEAAMQRKVIEKLRDKHFQRWLDERNRKELAEQDEIGMQLSYRNLTNEAGEMDGAATTEGEA
jgi:flagellar protein FliJ